MELARSDFYYQDNTDGDGPRSGDPRNPTRVSGVTQARRAPAANRHPPPEGPELRYEDDAFKIVNRSTHTPHGRPCERSEERTLCACSTSPRGARRPLARRRPWPKRSLTPWRARRCMWTTLASSLTSLVSLIYQIIDCRAVAGTTICRPPPTHPPTHPPTQPPTHPPTLPTHPPTPYPPHPTKCSTPTLTPS